MSEIINPFNDRVSAMEKETTQVKLVQSDHKQMMTVINDKFDSEAKLRDYVEE